MKISTLFYTIKQGFVNIFRNKWFSLASIATISACLFLFGLFFCIIYNIRSIVLTAEQGVSVSVFFDEGTDEDLHQQILIQAMEGPGVLNVEYKSADAAWEDFKTEYLGEYADGFTENPLADSASLEITMSDVSKQPQLVSFLEQIPGVRTVNRSEVTAATLTGVNQLIAYVSVGIIIILLAVSVFLISNTVTIGISVRKEEISIMKYIGATDFFVRAPFVIEGMLIGAVGAAIPDVIIYFLYNKVIAYVGNEFDTLSEILTFISVQEVFRYLIPVSLLVGVGIGFFGSISTVRKHLRV